MKHIISLSLNYIHRQKLRTVLTFFCVTLSVFIFCSFGEYIGSILQILLNECKRVGGSYESSIDSWLGDVDNMGEVYGEVYGTGDNLNIDSESGIIVSSWLENLYYSVGDTIKFTL